MLEVIETRGGEGENENFLDTHSACELFTADIIKTLSLINNYIFFHMARRE